MFTLLKAFLPAAWPLWVVEAIFWVVAGLAVWGVWELRVAEPYRMQGEVRLTKKMNGPKGQLTALNEKNSSLESDLKQAKDEGDQALANLATTKGSLETVMQKLEDCTGRANQWLNDANDAKAASVRLQQELQTRKQRYADVVEAARRIAANPSHSTEGVEPKVHKYLIDLSTWRNQK